MHADSGICTHIPSIQQAPTTVPTALPSKMQKLSAHIRSVEAGTDPKANAPKPIHASVALEKPESEDVKASTVLNTSVFAQMRCSEASHHT